MKKINIANLYANSDINSPMELMFYLYMKDKQPFFDQLINTVVHNHYSFNEDTKVKLKNKEGKYRKFFFPENHEDITEKFETIGWQLVKKSICPTGDNKTFLDNFTLVHPKGLNIILRGSVTYPNNFSINYNLAGLEDDVDQFYKEGMDKKIHEILLSTCRVSYTLAKNPPKGATYHIISKNQYGLTLNQLNKSECTLPPEKISKSYPTINSEKIKDFFYQKDKGKLLLVHGEPGTGKTTYIRHMFTEYYAGSVILLNAEMLKNLSTADFSAFAIENLRNTVVLIEDAETVLVARGENHEGRTSIVSDLLNITDGIMGDAMNIKFVATFNTHVNEIDPAFLRKGRLYHREDVKRLTKEQAEEWLKFEKPLETYELTENDYSLADLYAMI